jgi:FAD/FMN-containing dehydrogenase
MADLQVVTLGGGSTTLKQKTVDEFKKSMGGQVVTPDTPGYDKVRSVWNAMIDRKPALIVRCAEAQDVVEAIRFARRHDLVVSVRGGGHNIAGSAVCDGGLMVDLSLMTSVQVDPTKRTARVAGGATLGDFDREAQAHGLATPLGINSTTGVAGLTLGGGFGWLSRRFGLSIDNLISVDIVTASGELIRANASQNEDLFWGVRGGGGNFGVVTSFEFRLHQVGPQVLAGLIVHPLDSARDVLRYYREFLNSTPEEFVCWFVLRLAPPLPFLPPEWHGKGILALAACYSGGIEEGERVAKPLRSFGKPLADVIGPAPFAEWQKILDPLLTPGARNYWKSHNFPELSDGLIDVMIEHARRIPDPQTEIACAQLGGAVGRVAKNATAYNHRDAQFVMNVHGRWEDPAKDTKCIEWARGLFKASTPFASDGIYMNFLTQEEQDRAKEAYGANYDRLVQLKNKYDPTNLFRLNPNVRPTQ